MTATKKSLLVSGISLVVCAMLFVGTTFAWFTDSVTNSGNKIQSGTLLIDAYSYDLEEGGTGFKIDGINGGEEFGFSETGKNLKQVTTPIINETLWEPGKSSAKLLRVQNSGTLAAKIKLEFVLSDGGLADALWFDFLQVDSEGNITGSFERKPISQLTAAAEAFGEVPLLRDESIQFILVYGMDESAGNTYQDKTFTADVSILAAQYTYETDGFNSSEYDSLAGYEGEIVVSDEAGFKEALGSVQEGETIILADDIEIAHTGSRPDGTYDTYITTPNCTIDLNGKTMTVTHNGYVFSLAADGITLKNGTIEIADKENTAYPLYVTNYSENVVIEDVTIVGGLQVIGGSSATLRNVNVTATTWYDVYLEYRSTVTIESGIFTSNGVSPHIYTNTASDSVIVKGGTFDGSDTPKYGGNGTVTIE